MIDICQSQVAMGVSCQVRAAAGFALIAADPKTWMVNLTELFPPPTLEGQNDVGRRPSTTGSDARNKR